MTETFTVTVTDDQNATSTQTVTITINGSDHVINGDSGNNTLWNFNISNLFRVYSFTSYASC